MKHTLELKLSQQLKLNPQLQQSIKLLQLSQLDLSQEIQYQLETNPLLSADNNPENSPLSSADQVSQEQPEQTEPSANVANQNKSHASIDDNFEQQIATRTGFREKLEFQIQMSNLSRLDLEIGYFIIESLNDNGFLTQSDQQIAQMVSQETGQQIKAAEVMAVIHLVQQLEPFGCACQNPQEYLALQLSQQSNSTIALSIINNAYSLLEKNNYQKICQQLSLNHQQLESAVEQIRHLQQQPNLEYADSTSPYIVPDIKVSLIDGVWQAHLYSGQIPQLGINHDYEALLKSSTLNKDKEYLKEMLQAARWFIHGLQARHSTIEKVATVIVNHQQEFFIHGESALRPLKLQDIADQLELHESTISRATSNKFLQAPQGVFELKYFFSNALQSSLGGEWSSKAIKSKIKQLVIEEPSKKPLSDNKIAQKLEQLGIHIARRTVTKYREALHIPSSSQRKQLSNFQIN